MAMCADLSGEQDVIMLTIVSIWLSRPKKMEGAGGGTCTKLFLELELEDKKLRLLSDLRERVPESIVSGLR